MPLQLFPPHPHLAPFLMHFMVLQLDGRASHLPAALSPNLTLVLRGGIRVMEADGSVSRVPRFVLSGPYLTSRRSFSDPGTLTISVMFRPALIEEALGIPAAEIHSRIVDVGAILGHERVEQLFADMDNEDRPVSDHVRLFQEFLLSTLNLTPKKKSIGSGFLAAHQKMFLPLVDLALFFGIGERQLERRVRQVFGVSLRDVRRMTRFGLTLPRLLQRPVQHGALTHIAQEGGYYDQAHMHREFVELSGLGPFQLLQKIASGDPAYWVYRVSQDDFKNLFIPVD